MAAVVRCDWRYCLLYRSAALGLLNDDGDLVEESPQSLSGFLTAGDGGSS
jgi:hypothetical protein